MRRSADGPFYSVGMTKTRQPIRCFFAALLAFMLLSPVALAQATGSQESAAAARRTVAENSLAERFVGAFSATIDGVPVRWHAMKINVADMPGAVYFEVARADDLAYPFRQGVIAEIRTAAAGERILRFFDVTRSAEFRASIVGLWADPSLFPEMSLADLSPNLDIVLDGSMSGKTRNPVPTMRGGATLMTSELRLLDDGFEVADRGYDMGLRQVWGPASGATRFTPAEPAAAADKRESGLTIVTLDPGSGEPHAEGGKVALQYTGWLTTGRMFDTSRRDDGEPFALNIPGRVIPGFNEGVAGIRVGEKRRLIIPGNLAYGPRGRPGVIPPDATLIFEIECVYLENPESAASPTGDG